LDDVRLPEKEHSMKWKRYTEAQIAVALHQAELGTVVEALPSFTSKHGSKTTTTNTSTAM